MLLKSIVTVERNLNEVDKLDTNDRVSFTLFGGEEVEAIAVREDTDGMLFVFVDCIEKEYPMNEEHTNRGGYEGCDLRKNLNGEILDRFPAEIREHMIAFENGDLLRIPTEKEIFGENQYGMAEIDTEQLEAMKERRNRMALEGLNGDPQWYWLRNPVHGSATSFAYVYSDGYAGSYGASSSLGVRPCFKLRIKKS